VPTIASRGTLWLKLRTVGTPPPSSIKALFLRPLKRFVTEHKLGNIHVVTNDMLDPGNSVEFSVYSPTDDFGDLQFSGYVAFRVDGTAIVTDLDDKVLLRGSWVEAGQWTNDFFAAIARGHASATKQLSLLEKAARLLS